MLFLILACTGNNDSEIDPPEDSAVTGDSVASCVAEDGDLRILPENIITPSCADILAVGFAVVEGEGYVAIDGMDCGFSPEAIEVWAYPTLEPVLTYDFGEEAFGDGIPLLMQAPGQAWMMFGLLGDFSGGRYITGIDIGTDSTTFIIEDAYKNGYPSTTGDLIGWSVKYYGQNNEPSFSAYDLQTLPQVATRADAIATYLNTANAIVYYASFVPATNGDGLGDLIASAWTGPGSTGMLLVDHADAITDQGYFNGVSLPGDFGTVISAPDWDGDGLPDLAVYGNNNKESDLFVYRGTDMEPLAHYYRDPALPVDWATPFGFGAQTVDGLLEEGQQAILLEDRDTPEGDRIRILVPGSCGTEPIVETPYLLRDPNTVEYLPFRASGDLMLQSLISNELLLSSNQFQ
jgi:hypothetical protein